MKYRIRHVTTYRYQDKVSLSQNHARLTPLTTPFQKSLVTHIEVEPKADFQTQFFDYFGNQVTLFEVPTMHDEMKVTAISEVEVTGSAMQGLFSQQNAWEWVRQEIARPQDVQGLQALEFSVPTRLTEANKAIKDYTLASFTKGRSIVDACDDLVARIFTDFAFDATFSTVNTPVSHVFEHKRGVCQDFAHLTLTCLRSLGLAARYVSGYIETLPPPGQEKLTGADATHAWISVFIPGSGWLDYDPTNNLRPYDQHVTLAMGRDFNDVTPLKGIMFGGGAHTLEVAVDMERLEG